MLRLSTHLLFVRIFAVAALLWYTQVQAAVEHSQSNTRVFSVHIGVNQAPPDSDLRTLQFADDDATRFYNFNAAFAEYSRLLTVMDKETQRRFPQLVAKAQAPRRIALLKALRDIKERLLHAKQQGAHTVVHVSYSGHGYWDAQDGKTRLTLLDDGIDHEWLKTHIFSLPAHSIHLFIDACQAQHLVSGRGHITSEHSAQARPLTPSESSLLRAEIMGHYPHVGIIYATSSDQKAHEWSQLQAGIFTHELLGALSGAADINADGVIAYSEIGAYISAANRAIKDVRASISLVLQPPKLNYNTAVLSLRWLPQAALLHGVVDEAQHFYLEDGQGVRLLDAHPEKGSYFWLLLPTSGEVWVRRALVEARLQITRGVHHLFSSLRFKPTTLDSRGAMGSAMQRGFFATPYGAAYYRGWVDSIQGIPVTFNTRKLQLTKPDTFKALLMFSLAGASLAGAAAFTGGTIKARADYNATDIERSAADARRRYHLFQGLAIGSGVTAAVFTTCGIIFWKKRETPLVTPIPLQGGAGISFSKAY